MWDISIYEMIYTNKIKNNENIVLSFVKFKNPV